MFFKETIITILIYIDYIKNKILII